MLFESIYALTYKKQFAEKYEDKENNQNIQSTNVTQILNFTMIVGFVITTVLWIRITIIAFSCKFIEGISCLLFPSMYALFKFGDFIKFSCAKNIM
jgi:hypothetical protein